MIMGTSVDQPSHSERSSMESIPMKMHLRRRFMHRRLIAGLLLASCTWLSSTESWAGCSHLVKGGANASPSAATRLDRLVSLATFADDSSAKCSARKTRPHTLFRRQMLWKIEPPRDHAAGAVAELRLGMRGVRFNLGAAYLIARPVR